MDCKCVLQDSLQSSDNNQGSGMILDILRKVMLKQVSVQRLVVLRVRFEPVSGGHLVVRSCSAQQQLQQGLECICPALLLLD